MHVVLHGLHSQLERGFFSVSDLCSELDVSDDALLHSLVDLYHLGAVESLQGSPYLRITPEGRRLLVQ